MSRLPANKRALRRWAAARPRTPLHYLGVDEIFLGKTVKFLTVVSDLESGEPLWVGLERKRETLDQFFAEALPPARRRAVRAVCVDMWEPFRLSLKAHVPHDMMEADTRTCEIIDMRGTGIAQRPPGTCNILIDPFAYREVPTLAGRKQASRERLLAHEMGHAATNVHDTGPGRMDNVILNENPVVRELGLRERIAYDVPFWWYLPFIGYPAPRGVEVPRR